MSSVAWVRRFARNHAWSNNTLDAACARLSPEEYVAKRTSFFPSIHLTLRHIALVDDYERERVDDVFFHMTTHAIHHRGQVHAMLAGTSVVPPQLDEYFLAVDRPKAETELASAGFDTSACH
jgi:uncharacterized damage-inducible protein DinB